MICQNDYAIDEYNRGGVVEQIEHQINAIPEDSAWSKKAGADPLSMDPQELRTYMLNKQKRAEQIRNHRKKLEAEKQARTLGLDRVASEQKIMEYITSDVGKAQEDEYVEALKEWSKLPENQRREEDKPKVAFYSEHEQRKFSDRFFRLPETREF